MRTKNKIFRLTELQLEQLDKHLKKEGTTFTDFIHSLIQREVTASPADDNGPQIAPKLDIDRNRQSIAASPERDDSELQSSNRRIVNSVSKYRYCGNIKSEIEHRFVFSLTSKPPSDHKPSVTGHQDRPRESREVYSNSSTASHSEPKQANQQSVSEPFDGKIEQPESISRTTWDSDIRSVDSFNQFLFRLSNQKQSENYRSTKANDPTELTSNHQSSQLFEQPTEIYRSKSQLGIIDCIAEKADNLKQYTSRASNSLSSHDYEKIEKIIKNDEIMLKYLNCEIILEPQNDRFKSQRQAYQNCLDSFEGIKSLIAEKKAPIAEKHFSQPSPEPENKPQQSRDFDF